MLKLVVSEVLSPCTAEDISTKSRSTDARNVESFGLFTG